MKDTGGFGAIFYRSVLQLVRRLLYWVGFFILPLFGFFFMSNIMDEGLPTKVPAAIVDLDHSPISRNITQNLASMQLVDIQLAAESFTMARQAMQEGTIYGAFLIPENFQADLLAGRSPEITFYTNMTYFVPGSLLFKNFKTTAIYTKSGVMMKLMESAGADPVEIRPLLLPVNIESRPIGNPWLNYAIYLCNSFEPAILQLMIFLLTVFSLGQEIKYGTSVHLMQMANGSIVRAIIAKLLPQTIVWVVIAVFMMSWLFYWNHYPMNCPWWRMALSEFLYVLACQGFALFIFGVLPNLRLSLSVCALLGVLTFSLAAFSFPIESMYGGVAIFSYILPSRYNFLIYIDQALNGLSLYYSRWWYTLYFAFMLLPLTMLWRIKKAYLKPVYAP